MGMEEIVFDKKVIDECNSKVNDKLIKYVRENIHKEYELNDDGHNLEHINYVLKRAYELSYKMNINFNILYVIVNYHDISCHIDRERHEILSAEIMYADNNLKKYFSENEMMIMRDAIEDHRASLEYEPRNIYGRILSSADRKVEISVYLKSSISYFIKNNPGCKKEEAINHAYDFAIKKFGRDGYAIKKMYIDDERYRKYLDEIQYLIDNRSEFYKRANKIYSKLLFKYFYG
jgi:uncharacterized protein